MLHNIFFYC